MRDKSYIIQEMCLICECRLQPLTFKENGKSKLLAWSKRNNAIKYLRDIQDIEPEFEAEVAELHWGGRGPGFKVLTLDSFEGNKWNAKLAAQRQPLKTNKKAQCVKKRTIRGWKLRSRERKRHRVCVASR